MKWKIQWFVKYDPRQLRYDFVEGPFDRLKDAKKFVKTLEYKYWIIERQEYSLFRYRNTNIVDSGWNKGIELMKDM